MRHRPRGRRRPARIRQNAGAASTAHRRQSTRARCTRKREAAPLRRRPAPYSVPQARCCHSNHARVRARSPTRDRARARRGSPSVTATPVRQCSPSGSALRLPPRGSFAARLHLAFLPGRRAQPDTPRHARRFPPRSRRRGRMRAARAASPARGASRRDRDNPAAARGGMRPRSNRSGADTRAGHHRVSRIGPAEAGRHRKVLGHPEDMGRQIALALDAGEQIAIGRLGARRQEVTLRQQRTAERGGARAAGRDQNACEPRVNRQAVHARPERRQTTSVECAEPLKQVHSCGKRIGRGRIEPVQRPRIAAPREHVEQRASIDRSGECRVLCAAEASRPDATGATRPRGRDAPPGPGALVGGVARDPFRLEAVDRLARDRSARPCEHPCRRPP